MASILSSVMFIKSASGTHTVTGVAVCRVEEQEYVQVNYKAFRMNATDNHLVDRIEKYRIMSIVGKFLFASGQLYVSILSVCVKCSFTPKLT